MAISSLLPQLAPAKAAVLRELFTKADALVLEGEPTTTWQFHLAQAVSPHGMLLRGAHAEVALNVAEDGLAERLGEREWWDYDDESACSRGPWPTVCSSRRSADCCVSR